MPATTSSTHSATPLVVHIISGLGQGGAETVLYRLTTASANTTRSVVISLGDSGLFGPRLEQAGIPVHCMHMKGWGLLTGVWRLRSLLKRLQPDIVQTWMYHADLIGGLVARSVGLKTVVWGIRNSGENLHHSSPKARVIAWLCARLSTTIPAAIVACAEKAARQHKQWGYAAHKLHVIPNGYDLSRWQPQPLAAEQFRQQLTIDAATPLIAAVGRWNPLKDYPNLLAALAKLKRQSKAWHCVLVGKGLDPTNEELMRLLQSLDLVDYVSLLGPRNDVPSIMAAADIHVLASKAEGFPNVVCEAMASRALCVVTQVGDAARIVGEEGIVVPPQNAAALAGGLEKALHLLRSPTLSQQLDRAQQRVQRLYSLDTMVHNYLQLWQQVGQHQTIRPAPLLLYVVNNPAFFLSHRLPLALAAQQAGYQVQVATMDGPETVLIEQHGFSHHVIPLNRSGKNPFKELYSLWALYRLFRRVRPQLIHTVTIKPVLYGGIAARLARVPAMLAAVSGLGYVFLDPKQSMLRRIALRLYRSALKHPHSRVIFQNTNDQEVLVAAKAIRAEQAVLIRGSGVNLETFGYTPEKPTPPVNVLMVARLLADKGVYEYVQAAQYSQSQGQHLVWQIAGSPDEGNPSSVSTEQMRQWHQSGAIQWLGEQDHIAQLYAQAHIAVLPSYREGLPLSLVEAAACGRAVVTTDVPGCRDAIEAERTGVLVPVQDAQALYAAVADLAQNPDKRQKLGRAGRDLAERAFDIQSVIDTHLRLYDYLAPSSKKAALK